MITKEQALTENYFIQVAKFNGTFKLTYTGLQVFVPNGTITKLDKPIKWRASGKCKTWKTRPEEFKLPIKHGLYDYSYIDNTNCHLFEVLK